MNLDEFKSSIIKSTTPPALTSSLQAMWYDGKGDWNRAHDVAQEISTSEGSWIHAYLHRKEGDQSNAVYWYHRANRPVCKSSLEKEWDDIVTTLLSA